MAVYAGRGGVREASAGRGGVLLASREARSTSSSLPLRAEGDHGMGSRTCPQCGLLSPPSASRCDCGHNFDTGVGGDASRLLGVEPGIRGWLAFFSIGVWVSPLILSYYSIQGLIEASDVFEKSTGRPLDLSAIYLLLQRVPTHSGAVIFFARAGLFVALIGVSIWLLTQWWRRKRQFPRNWIIFQ